FAKVRKPSRVLHGVFVAPNSQEIRGIRNKRPSEQQSFCFKPHLSQARCKLTITANHRWPRSRRLLVNIAAVSAFGLGRTSAKWPRVEACQGPTGLLSHHSIKCRFAVRRLRLSPA